MSERVKAADWLGNASNRESGVPEDWVNDAPELASPISASDPSVLRALGFTPGANNVIDWKHQRNG